MPTTALVVASLSVVDFSPLSHGGVVVARAWLPPTLVSALRADASALLAEGAFTAVRESGQKPGDTDRLVRTVTHDLGGDGDARAAFDRRLEALRSALDSSLGRPGLTCAEMYYSVHPEGTALRLHMDERHEETKGDRGWAATSRRSVSWLVYLNAPGWDGDGPEPSPEAERGAGGALRIYCRDGVVTPAGAHESNLQVGWLAEAASASPVGGRWGSRAGEDAAAGLPPAGPQHPVFLDCWVRPPAETAGRVGRGPEAAGSSADQPLYALYRLGADGGRRSYLTPPFAPGSMEWPQQTGSGMTAADLASAFASQLPAALRPAFCGVEAIGGAGQRPLDVSPLGGTLVLFNSAALPHEVLPVRSGRRFAMAGWFHEPQQPFPDWYGG